VHEKGDDGDGDAGRDAGQHGAYEVCGLRSAAGTAVRCRAHAVTLPQTDDPGRPRPLRTGSPILEQSPGVRPDATGPPARRCERGSGLAPDQYARVRGSRAGPRPARSLWRRRRTSVDRTDADGVCLMAPRKAQQMGFLRHVDRAVSRPASSAGGWTSGSAARRVGHG
jgi:hypothetical protein